MGQKITWTFLSETYPEVCGKHFTFSIWGCVVFIGAVWNPIRPPCPLIYQCLFDFFSFTIACEVTSLAINVLLYGPWRSDVNLQSDVKSYKAALASNWPWHLWPFSLQIDLIWNLHTWWKCSFKGSKVKLLLLNVWGIVNKKNWLQSQQSDEESTHSVYSTPYLSLSYPLEFLHVKSSDLPEMYF